MYFRISTLFIILSLVSVRGAFAQSQEANHKTIELGFNVSGDETLFYGVYGKFTVPFSQKKHHFIGGVSLISYFDFTGESTSEAFLRNDIDMRIIPNVFLGYSLNFNKVQVNLATPLGASVAITKGTLVNEKIGFERDFSNSEVFLNFGVDLSFKYQLNNKNYIGVYSFLPLVEDKAQSGYQFGIGWTKAIKQKAD